jgi:hypothetical protein
MANAPLVERDGGINKSVSTKWRSRIFLQRRLDTPVNKPPVGQISRMSRSTRPGASRRALDAATFTVTIAIPPTPRRMSLRSRAKEGELTWGVSEFRRFFDH